MPNKLLVSDSGNFNDNNSSGAELKVAGTYFGGWTSLSITRSIENIAGTFSLELTERWPGQKLDRAIRPGESCQVLLDGEVVIDGYIDDLEPEFDKQSHSVRVTGRDRTGDLVDCSAIYKTGQWHNISLPDLAKNLLADFKIGIVIEVETGKNFQSWNIEEGESIFECLTRAARMKGVLLVSDAKGNLVITRAGKATAGVGLLPVLLQEGVNILSASGNFSWKDRYSKYIIKGQGKGSDYSCGPDAAQISASVKDEAISRHRPFVLISEEHGYQSELKDRIEWEKSVRVGRSGRASITVQGWHRPDDDQPLWQPNTMVHVTSRSIYVDAPLLIVGCTWRLDERGTITQLAVARREAFELLSGVSASKLEKKMFAKEQKDRKIKGEDWSIL